MDAAASRRWIGLGHSTERQDQCHREATVQDPAHSRSPYVYLGSSLGSFDSGDKGNSLERGLPTVWLGLDRGNPEAAFVTHEPLSKPAVRRAASRMSRGVFDTHGNVWEWCCDGKRTHDAPAHVDPEGPVAAHDVGVLRGCSRNNGPASLRAAYRLDKSPDSPHVLLRALDREITTRARP
jgi:hypothetical protein